MIGLLIQLGLCIAFPHVFVPLFAFWYLDVLFMKVFSGKKDAV